jgi:hypothetical protein
MGRTVKEICEVLDKDGIRINYSRLRSYVALLKKEDGSARLSPPTGAGSLGRPTTAPDSGPSEVDPAAAIRVQRSKSQRFQHNPFSSKKRDLV